MFGYIDARIGQRGPAELRKIDIDDPMRRSAELLGHALCTFQLVLVTLPVAETDRVWLECLLAGDG